MTENINIPFDPDFDAVPVSAPMAETKPADADNFSLAININRETVFDALALIVVALTIFSNIKAYQLIKILI